MKKLILSCGLLVIFILTGCKNVTVVSPEKDAVYPDTIPDFNVNWKQLPEDPLRYSLNSIDVTDLFLESGDRSVTAAAEDLAPFLVDGKNLFSISSGIDVVFFYDLSGPTLHITDVKGSSLLEISGYVDDPVGVRALSLADEMIELQSDNSFTIQLAANEIYDFHSEDSAGHVNETDIVVSGYEVNNGISSMVTASGVDVIADLVAEALADINLASLLRSVNPIFDEDAPLGNEARLDVTRVSFDHPRVAISVSSNSSNRLDIDVEISNLEIKTDAEGEVFYVDWESRGEITAKRVELTLDARLSTRSGKFVVSIRDIDADLKGFGFDINNFPDALEDLVDGIVSPLIESLLEDQLQDSVPDAVADVVSGVIPAVAFNINDSDIELSSRAKEFITTSNGIRLGLANSVTLLTPSELPARTLGSVYVASPEPSLSNVTPSGARFDFAAALNINLFNQILLAGYQGNELHIVSDSENEEGEIERIEIIPIVAPYLTLLSSPLAVGRLTLNDFTLQMSRKAPGSESFQRVFGAQLNTSVPFGLDVDEAGALTINLRLLPDVQVIAIEQNAALTLPPGFVQRVIDASLPALLPRLAVGVDGFQVPSLASSGVGVVDIWADPGLGYVIVAADLNH
ncbi:MAG: hypothetical protein MI976_23960 [Pseudomonadales bacterium]|nr:hypothetical protein [Pseudomonadales bacterium]